MADAPSGTLFHISDQLAAKAKHDRQHTITFGTIVGLAPAAVLGTSGMKITPGRTKLVEFLTGVAVKPAPGGFKVRPKAGAILYLAPAPLGVVPAEYYGLRPDYLKNFLPEFLQYETLGTKASPARVDEYYKKEIQRLLTEPAYKNFDAQVAGFTTVERNAKLLEPYRGQYADVNERLAIVDRQNARTRLLPPVGKGSHSVGVFGALFTLSDFEPGGSASLLPPAAVEDVDYGPVVVAPAPVVEDVPFLGGAILPGSSQPELYQPHTAAALAIQAAAKGIRKQLVSERADP